MKKFFIYCVLGIVAAGSCKKSQQSADDARLPSVCYQGKFLNGIACSDVAAIQLINPLVDDLDLSYKAADDSIYTAGIAVILPESFRDGVPFYFTMDSLGRTPPHLANCFYVPKYSAVIKPISRQPCKTETE